MTEAHARPLVLLSNDDGYRARGLGALREALLATFDVVVCAPDTEQSASSHALSLNRPLRLIERGPGVFSVDGTPADSIYVALHAEQVLPRKPALVLSGMNHGVNLGQDVFYSGTVAAAREGALHGYVALALSASEQADTEHAAEAAARLALATLRSGLVGPRLFNVNFPPGRDWPLRATRLGKREYGGGLIRRDDPRGLPYYWIGGSTVHHESIADSDTEACDAGVVGVTPLVLDLWSSHLEDDSLRLVRAVGALDRPELDRD